jgi:hypothetical protein
VITAYGGTVLLRATMRAVGLAAAVNTHVHLKQRARGPREAEFVTGVARMTAVVERPAPEGPIFSELFGEGRVASRDPWATSSDGTRA